MTRIEETLNPDAHTGMTPQGDIVSLYDIDPDQQPPMPDEYRIARMHPHDDHAALAEADAERHDSMETVRNLADFTQRNEALKQMAVEVGKANRHDGAFMRMTNGSHIRPYRNADHAYELAAWSRAKARRLGETACDACPIAEFCDTNTGAVAIRIEQDAATRKRFKSRVEHEDNDHLCETNLKPGRQKNSIA